MEYNIQLVVGDWSHDGHNQTEIISINSNFSKEEIKKAYKDGVDKLGFDVTKFVCASYEESSIDFEDWQKLNEAGLTLGDLGLVDRDLDQAKKYLDQNQGFGIDSDIFVHLYCFVVKHGNSNFRYDIVQTITNSINIGGYGFFYTKPVPSLEYCFFRPF